MRRIFLLLSVLVSIALASALLPYLYGFYTQRDYYNYVEQINNQIRNKEALVLKIDSYDRGWFTSTVKLSLSSPQVEKMYANPNKKNDLNTIQIQSVIHHGPVVQVNNEYMLAFAYIDSNVVMPTIIQFFLQTVSDIDAVFMNVKTKVTDFGNMWNSAVEIKPVSFNEYGKWNGLNGDITVSSRNHQLSHAISNLNYGAMEINLNALGLPNIKVSPLKYTHEINFGEDQKSMRSNALLNIDNVDVHHHDQSIFNLSSFKYKSADIYTSPLYSYQSQTDISMLKLAPNNLLNEISKFVLNFKIDNLNIDKYIELINYNELTSMPNQKEEQKRLLALITKQSSIDSNIQFNSNLGFVNATINAHLQDVPNDIDDLPSKAIVTITANLSHHYAEYLLTAILDQPRQPGYDSMGNMTDAVTNNVSPEDIKKALDTLVTMGYLLKQNDQYTVSLFIENNTIKINNLPPTAIDLIGMNIFRALTPPTSTAACYWMEIVDGKQQWVVTPVPNKHDCFELDSCNGGQGKSMGGCYKWATSVEAEREVWDKVETAPSPMHPGPVIIPPAVQKPVPEAKTKPDPDAKFACYWQDPTSESKEWILTIVTKKDDCYALDSCHGGQGKDGTCYKWAQSAEDDGIAWDR